MDVVTYALLNGKIKNLSTTVEGMSDGFTYKGSVASTADLPDDAVSGDMYTIDGVKYVWDGTDWVQVRLAITAGDVSFNSSAEYSNGTVGKELKSLGTDKVPTSRTVNGNALSSDVTIGPGDIIYNSSETYNSGTIGAEVKSQSEAIDADSSSVAEAFKGIFPLPIVWEVGTYSETNRQVKADYDKHIRSSQTSFSVPGKFAYLTLPSNMTLWVVDLTASTQSSKTASTYVEFDPTHKYNFKAKHTDNTPFSDASIGSSIKFEFLSDFLHVGQCVTPSNYSSVLPDANNAPDNSIYRIYFTLGTSNYPAHLPDIAEEIAEADMFGILETIAQKASTSFTLQRFYTGYGTYTRSKTTASGSYSSWVKYNDRLLSIKHGYFNASTAQTVIPDLDNAENNTIYIGYLTSGATHPVHMPIAITTTSVVYIATYGDGTYKIQQFENRGKIWFRNKVSTVWTPWFSIEDYYPRTYTVGKTGAEDFSSLAEAIETAIAQENSTVIVKNGTFDILSEYQTLHPTDWDTRNDGRGINLNNGIHLIFDSKSKVTCNYEGDDENVLTNFSAFNIRYGSAVIENATIVASRVRYCVHDDMWTSSTPYHVRYKDCNMSLDNSENPYRSKYPHCIGGGFGQDAHIDIEDCIFNGIGGDGTGSYDAPDDNAIVSWHNGSNASQRSALFMHGCYFKGTGTFRSLSNGTDTAKSTLLISGNSFGSAIVEGYVSGADVPNMEVIAFNNEIRNS